ncbi:MAG: beta/gamma crystallin family protein [Bacteroidales bacterium]|nr:beta/gamma crystallin family protein [Bacteroidales bacterium]
MLIVVLAIATNVDGQTKSTRAAGVYLYQHPNYGGDSRYFNANTPNLDADNINFADVASSVQVVDVPGVNLYDGRDYSGAMLPTSADIPDLTIWGFNDRIGSLKIVASPTQGAILYEHPNYGGDWRIFETNAPDLDIGTINFADVASSLQLLNIGGVSV